MFEATLREMSTKADPATKTYKVTFAMRAPDDVNILPGMVGEVQLESRANGVSGQPKAMIPATAVQGNRHGERYVWVVTDNSTVERRPVALGWLTPGNRYTVGSGIQQGERVVTSGATFLYEGEHVVLGIEDVASEESSRSQEDLNRLAHVNGR
jgi:RND family efflux transporter MFP subunit